MRCNGHEALCARRYDEVAYATTHNAMATQDDAYWAPNHFNAIPTQLADGVRGLMLDTHFHDGEPRLCHGRCDLGQHLLVDVLGELRAFLEANPREVLTIIFEAYISPEQTAAAFEESGLAVYVHTLQADGPFPTLGEMVDADRRLVVLSDSPGGPPWHHDVWSYAFETHWSVDTIEDFDCAPNRGDPAHPLFILNHFITNPVAFFRVAEQANAEAVLLDHAQRCLAAFGRVPNFVTVDFYSLGDVLSVVDTLNGVAAAD